MYGSQSPLLGEKPAYTVDFYSPSPAPALMNPDSVYQSTTENTGGEVQSLFGYTNDASKPLLFFLFRETHHQGIPTPDFTTGASTQAFMPVFGPPTNDGKHFEGFLLQSGAYDGIPPEIPRYKAVFDKVP